MIEMGLIVALGLIVMMARTSWHTKLWMTSHPLAVDVLVFIVLSILHWGTFSGMMVAAVGALFCSLTLSVARRVIGYIAPNGTYVRGFLDVSLKVTKR